MCACRLGACEVNNNRSKAKKPSTNTKRAKKPVVRESSSDWSDSDSDCSGCSACNGSSSSCSCSECNMETDSSDCGPCYGSACGPRAKKPTKKKSNNNNKNGKVLQCRDGVCEWVSKKKVKKPANTKKPAAKNVKTKKTKATRNCYDCSC